MGTACDSDPTQSPCAIAVGKQAKALMNDMFLDRLISVAVIEQPEDRMTLTVGFHADQIDRCSQGCVGITGAIRCSIYYDMRDAYELLYQADLRIGEASIAANLGVAAPPDLRPEGRVVYRTTMDSSTGAAINWGSKARLEFNGLWVVDYLDELFR